MHSFISPQREQWVQAEYNFDIPAVIILIPRRLGMSVLTGQSTEPERICRVLTDMIESHYPVLKGCVVCSFHMDAMRGMWSVYVVHNSLKRVHSWMTPPCVRMLYEGETYLPTDNETDKLPIRDDVMQPDIVISSVNIRTSFDKPDSPLIVNSE